MKQMTYADPDFDRPGRIDALLGAGICAAVQGSVTHKIEPGFVAQETTLG